MAFNNKKKNANYISAKESRAIAAGEPQDYAGDREKKKQKAYSGGGICDKDEESGELR